MQVAGLDAQQGQAEAPRQLILLRVALTLRVDAVRRAVELDGEQGALVPIGDDEIEVRSERESARPDPSMGRTSARRTFEKTCAERRAQSAARRS